MIVDVVRMVGIKGFAIDAAAGAWDLVRAGCDDIARAVNQRRTHLPGQARASESRPVGMMHRGFLGRRSDDLRMAYDFDQPGEIVVHIPIGICGTAIRVRSGVLSIKKSER